MIAVTMQVRLAAKLTQKTAALKQRHRVSFLRHEVTEIVVKFLVIAVGQTFKNHPCQKPIKYHPKKVVKKNPVPITVAFFQNLNGTLVLTQLEAGTKKYRSLVHILSYGYCSVGTGVKEGVEFSSMLIICVDMNVVTFRLGRPDKSNFHHHRDMNMTDKHIAKDCLTRDE